MSSPILAHRSHSVKFYEDRRSLVSTVGAFVAEGLSVGQPGIVIATGDHRIAILENLRARLGVAAAPADVGQLSVFDAHELLEQFMVDGEPDAAAFDETVGALVGRTLARHSGVPLRAYGEMVDVLWQSGQADAAIKLEMLWNKLAATHGFALLCGYSMGSFYKQAELMEQVIAQHSSVHRCDDAPKPRARRRSPNRRRRNRVN